MNRSLLYYSYIVLRIAICENTIKQQLFTLAQLSALTIGALLL